jgi:thioesterase domain-containing protein/aryl carrier-like protein
VFLAPFDVGAGEERLLHVRVDRGADATFLLYGDAPEAAFARGRFALVDAGPGAKLEVEAIRARCPREGPVSERRLVQHFMDFGPRWACVDAIRLGDREALLELSLPAEFAGDLASYRLHPALLDMAVGGAQALADGFDPGAHFYVPFSYGRVLVRGPMTARMTSHVRLREGGSKESVAFDADIYDGATLEPVVRVEAFVMRRVDAAASGRASGSRPAFGRSQVRSRSAALRVGMTPAEGLDAWSRMLRAPVSPQMVACTVALDRWLDRLERESRELRSRKDAPKDTGAPVFARPSLSAAFAAPRSTLERELAGIWQDLLGVAEVGIHDDFFELGGQSLIAVRMFHRIGKKYGVELPLATLFEAPTIARCASLLRERLGPKLEEEDAARPPPALRGDSPRSPLVAIQPGDPGRTPFFCVHGAGGNVLNFRDLARALGQDQPFYGLQATGIDGMARPAETIEEMAAEYVGAIRRLQPEGPYLLGGYSGGGVVAFEMARTLTASGQKVSVLALLDTFHPQMPIRAVTVRSRLERFLEEGPAYIREGLERRRTAAHVQEQRRRIAEARVRGEAIPLELRDLHLTRSFERAVKRYLPTEWAGRAILFRAERVAYIYRDGGPCYGWDRHVLGGVDVVPVAGDHSTLLLGGNATVVARVLREAIARVPPVLAVPVTLEATVTNRGAASSSWHGSH